MGIEEIRSKIDAIDHALAEKTAERLALMKDVAEYKNARGLPILDSTREKEVLAKNAQRFPEALRPYGERFFRSIMDICKEYQAKIFPRTPPAISEGIIGFQGVEGSFSHEALENYFGLGVQCRPYPLFEDAAKALQEGEVHYAVLPIENSSTGAINEVYDLLLKYNLNIAGEKILTVRHNLLGVKGAGLKNLHSVYSHIQGLRQCSLFLKEHPHIQPMESSNTAAAARMVAEKKDPCMAAIASVRAGEIYGLEILAPDIHNTLGNSTRFIIVSRSPQGGPANKMSACFMLAHKPGSLCAVLKVLEEYKLNMTKLESRPMPERPWEYIFYLDFEASPAEQSVQEALKKLSKVSSDFTVLGAYQADGGQR